MKRLILKLVLGLVFLGLMSYAVVYFYEAEAKAMKVSLAKADKSLQDDINEIKARSLINTATSNEDLRQAETLASTLPALRMENLYDYIRFKRSLFYFNEAEDFLRKAVEIEAAAGGNPQSLHPLAKSALDKAMVLYDKARKEAEKLKDTGDHNLDFSVNYLKGEIYYRFLELAADRETAVEIFNQTVTYYKQALRHKPNDINTVVNIELLIKNQSGLLANASDLQQKKKQMLNSKKFGVNKSSGN